MRRHLRRPSCKGSSGFGVERDKSWACRDDLLFDIYFLHEWIFFRDLDYNERRSHCAGMTESSIQD